ncbi:MAG: ATP-binding cassette domain-containing protein [Clostridia bacterium]|jgi:ABC-2 type transport system ATP-binding protein
MLRLENLTKRYGHFLALDGLSLEIERGTIFGFVGPNGAGKTTTMKIVATLLPPTSGKAYVDGIDVSLYPEKVRERIGYMPDFFGVYDNLKVTEYLDFYGDSYGIPFRERQKLIPEILELVELLAKKDSYVDTLSRGMKQRLCLARCLIHNPDLLILDEPASGMDPRARAELKGILRTLKEMGKTIMISSHILPELSELCDTVGILEKGKLVISGSMGQIMERIGGNMIIRIRLLHDLERAVRLLKEQPLVKGIIQEGNELEVSYQGQDEDLWKLLKALVNREMPVVSFSKAEGNLEKIFMEVTTNDELS